VTQSSEEETELRSVALRNLEVIQSARQRAEQELRSAKDALERKTQELASSLALVKATLESATDGILVLDERNIVSEFNENFAKMWRIPAAALKGADMNHSLGALCGQFADPVLARAGFDAMLASPAPSENDVIELEDGRVLERFCKVQILGGAALGRVWSFRDITESRRAQEQLRDEARTLEILKETGEALATNLDEESLVQAVTNAATEAVGARFGAFFHNHYDEAGGSYLLYTLSGASREAFEKLGQPRPTALFGPTFRGAPPIRSSDILQDPRYAKTGSGMPAGHLPVRSYLAVSVTSRSGEVIGGLFFGHPDVGVFTERSERIVVGIAAQAAVGIDNARLYEAARRSAKEREELLSSERSARASAERMSEMKDEFLATLSHELRTPLNAILGWSQMLRSGNRSEAEVKKGLETIERNARAQTQLVEDLLDMSRILSGKVRLDVQTLEPRGFIEAAIDTVRPAATAKNIRIESSLDPMAGPVSGDQGRLQQVIWNLLSNAIKFTPRGGKVQLSLERVSSHVELSVSDTGIGIKPEFLPFVFDRFRQADSSTTRHHGGLGLGLSIVKHLVELHGGTVHVSSPGDGQGTMFSVHLPLVAVHRNPHTERLPAASSQAAVEFAAINLAGVKVLIVDDEADARELLRHVLVDCAATVVVAASAAEALLLFEQHRPHVLLSDIGMPNTDGYDLLRRVRLRERDLGGRVPAIALTAFARSEDRTRALRAGFLVHLAKPVDPSELVATIASVLDHTSE
jgi:signal transduction histidine kinase/ActR/RegA family two-component response regulator